MDELQFEDLLKQQSVTFFWNEPNKFWWVRKTQEDGIIRRSNPAGAKNREAAEQAATKLIYRQFR